MNNDGRVIIGTELDTKGFDKQYERLKAKIENEQINLEIKAGDLEDAKRELQATQQELAKIKKTRDEINDTISKKQRQYDSLNAQIQAGQPLSSDEYNRFGFLDNTLTSLRSKQEEINKQFDLYNSKVNKANDLLTKAEAKYNIQKNKVEELQLEFQQLNSEISQTSSTELSQMNLSIGNIGNSIEKVTKKVVRWGLALFGIRSAYNFIRQSMSTLSQYNEQLATDVEYIRFTLATTLQPIIETIIKLVYQLLGLVNAVSKSLFGVDLFANASAKSFGKANKSAGELKKTLAGFDKVNVLNENGSTGALGGSIAPSFDLSQDNLFAKWDLKKFIEKGKEIATSLARGINDFFRNTDWASLGKTIGDGIIGAINIVDTFIKETDWELIGQSIADFILNVDWLEIAGSIIELLFDGMIAAMDLMTGVTEKIVEKMEDPQFWENLIESGKKAIGKIGEGMEKVDASLEKVWSKIISFFLRKLGINDNDANNIGKKIGEGIHNGIDVMLDNLPFIGTFRKIIKFAKQAFGINSNSKEFQDIGYQLMTGLKNGIKSGINGVIDIINTMIDKINGALAFKWNKIEIAGIKLLDAGSVNVGRIPRIPRLAAGGIVNMPGRGVDYYGANIGEKRPEGIVPLDNEASLRIIGETIAKNTKFNADITLELEGRILARVMKELNADRQFARNGG